MSVSFRPLPVVGIIGASFWGLVKLIGWIALGYLISLLMAGVLFCTKGEAKSFCYLQTNIDSSLVVLQRQALLSQALTRISKDFLNVERFVAKLSPSSSELKRQNVSNRNLTIIEQALEQVTSIWSRLIILITLLSLLRLFIFCLSLPLFFLLAWWGLIDGLVARDLRKIAGGRESALIYHRAKSYLWPALCWGAFCYLVLPVTLNPILVLMPFMLLFTLTLRLTASRFKKYL